MKTSWVSLSATKASGVLYQSRAWSVSCADVMLCASNSDDVTSQGPPPLISYLGAALPLSLQSLSTAERGALTHPPNSQMSPDIGLRGKGRIAQRLTLRKARLHSSGLLPRAPLSTLSRIKVMFIHIRKASSSSCLHVVMGTQCDPEMPRAASGTVQEAHASPVFWP